MQQFWRQTILPALLLLAGLSLSLPASATPPTKERLPLMLSGSGCTSQEEAMNKVLQAIPGVTGVYFNRVPDHVLVDINPGTVKADDVVNQVNGAATSWHCKVEIMQSCISAPPSPESAAAHH
jgi:cation transport ATPase